MNHSNSTSSVNENDYTNTSDSSTGQQPPSSQKSERSLLPDNSETAQQSVNDRKNTNHTYPTDGAMFFKILVPSAAAGAIIGKGGETIALLQQQSDTRIKMSKATDYFPGTNERVCIIYGPTPDSILQVYDFIAQKIRDKPEPGLQQKPPSPEYEAKQPSNERDKQVKILVPNSTAGMIIGKGGNFIKHIKEESGAYVQISQKARDHAITERCITVIGDVSQNRKACTLILAKIFEDPVSNSCPNLSYADVIGPVPNYNPTGSPFASVPHGGHAGVDHLMSSPYMHTTMQHNFFANLRSTLRLAGYTEEATAEIIAAMSTLANYGILGLGLGLGGMGMNPYMSGLTGLHGNQSSLDSGFGHSTGSSLAGNISSSSAGGSPGGYADGMSSSMSGASKSPLRYGGGLAGQESMESSYNGHYDQQVPNGTQSKQGFDGWSGQNRWSHQQRSSPQSYGSNGGLFSKSANHSDGTIPIVGGGSTSNGERSQLSFDIMDNLAGVLLSRDGKTISELQQVYSTQIQVLPKKKMAGQGACRTVTITGSPTAVQATHSMIQQRLNMVVDDKRNGQSENGSPASTGSSPQQQLPLSPSSQFA